MIPRSNLNFNIELHILFWFIMDQYFSLLTQAIFFPSFPSSQKKNIVIIMHYKR